MCSDVATASRAEQRLSYLEEARVLPCARNYDSPDWERRLRDWIPRPSLILARRLHEPRFAAVAIREALV